MEKLILCGLWLPHVVYLYRDVGSFLTGLTAMTSTRQSTLNSCCFQTYGLGMVMGVGVVEVPGLFYIYYGSGPLKAGKVIVCGLN